MSAIAPGNTVTGLFLLFTLASGVWLSSLGKPLNVPIFTLHKLIALGTVILLGLAITQLHKAAPIGTTGLAAIAITGLLFLSLFVSGALLSIGKPVSAAVMAIHRVAPLLAAGSAALTVYLLAHGRI